MDFASSDEWSTGCESGWAVYLDDSYYPQTYTMNNNDDDENQSMVSDASSGPPHFLQEYREPQFHTRISNPNNNCYSTISEKSIKPSGNKSKKRENKKVGHQQNLQFHGFSSTNHLDDTASSPAITHSQMYANFTAMGGYSQNMSATLFQGNSSYSNHYSFRQFNQPNDTENSAQPRDIQEDGNEKLRK